MSLTLNNTRLNSHALQINGVTNNPNNQPADGEDKNVKQQYQSNQVVSDSMMGRISSLKDEENLNQRWVNLLKLGNKMEAGNMIQNNSIIDETNQSINVTDLQNGDGYQPGKNTNLMIYSTLAAAFPYAHKNAASPADKVTSEEVKHPAMTVSHPTPIETGNMLDLSR